MLEEARESTEARLRGRWRPILEGETAARALETVEEIAAELRRLGGDSPEPESELTIRDRLRYSLAGGQTGQALLFAYLDRAFPGQGHDDAAMDLLARAIEELGQAQAPPGLYSGFAGVAWLVEHLQGLRLIELDEQDPNEEIVAALVEHLEHSPWRADYDLISGLVGYGVFSLERMPRPLGRECLEQVVARLAETAEHGPRGITWLTAPHLIPPRTRDEAPEGNYNTGLAHGIPGVVGLLGRVCACGVDVERARPLLEGAVAWLLAQKLPRGEFSIFPYSITPGRPPAPTRLAWCYGDLGIAASLLLAARHAGEPEWEREALAIARESAGRALEQSGVVDVGLCHGAVGNAHLFNRLYQASGEAAFAEAARYWYEQALAMRRPGEGIAQYVAFIPDASGTMGWHGDSGFLTGVAGVALAFLAATTPIEPAWDRVLLVDVPLRA